MARAGLSWVSESSHLVHIVGHSLLLWNLLHDNLFGNHLKHLIKRHMRVSHAFIGTRIRTAGRSLKALATSLDEHPYFCERYCMVLYAFGSFRETLMKKVSPGRRGLHFISVVNYGAPGVLKNALDWAPRPTKRSSFAAKPTLVITASPAHSRRSGSGSDL